MPRTRKPSGTPSGQRTDRNDAAAQQSPQVAAGSTTYGDRQKLEAAQQQQPLPDEQARFQRALQEGRGLGEKAVGMRGPSQRPREPITAGMDGGAGPGPASLARPEPALRPELVAAARWLPALERRAADPKSSSTFRQYVRMLRSQMPPELSPDQVADV